MSAARRRPILRMFVGVARLSFHLPGARSLKDKRQTVRSFRDRVRARMGVSIAEVAHQDLHQRATFGVAVVSNDAAVCDEVLAAVASMANGVRAAILVDRSTEIISIGAMGPSFERAPKGPFGDELGDELGDDVDQVDEHGCERRGEAGGEGTDGGAGDHGAEGTGASDRWRK